ncbi:hypothetical protein H0H92_004770 [Tricholoma furcatifolium]|nr:hypothetical protein H0H92_004770 [Tricholoma furcatifolium]
MSSKDPAYSGSTSYKPPTARPLRVDHSRQQAEHSKRAQEPSKSSERDSEYLDYYHSSLADGQVQDSASDRSTRLTRQTSGSSTSSSDYSDSQPVNEFSTTAPLSVTSRATRRAKAPSDGGSDRRRLAIVQVDPLDDPPPAKHQDHSRSSSIRARRGVTSNLAGIALVAPPDAAPKTYAHLTPPNSAPTTAESSIRIVTREPKSASEATTRYSSASDQVSLSSKRMPPEPHVIIDDTSLAPPGDRRSSRSPSPSGVSDVSERGHGLLSPATTPARPGVSRGNTPSLITTPEIGEGKDIGVPVAAPVVISLESAGPFRRKGTSNKNDSAVHPVSALPFPSKDRTYRHYEPGVDSTAGPLPPLPPPRAMFNIDLTSPAPPRPPRLNSPLPARTRSDLEAVKQALQLPPSVAAALASKKLKHETDEESQTPKKTGNVKSVHIREGAFSPAPSTSNMPPTIPDTSASETPIPVEVEVPSEPRLPKPMDDHISASDDDIVPPITVIRPMEHIEEQDDHEDKDVATEMIPSPPSKRRTSAELTSRNGSQSPPYHDHAGDTPSPPPKSFRNSLTTNLKRLSSSLPRTPSISSKSRRSSGGTYYSRTPSPPMHSSSPPARQKIISQYPPAMFYAEISTRKTPLERCSLYAQKINELYNYDSGLGDWTIETSFRVRTNHTNTTPSHTFVPQPRHTSRSSMISEVTFPRRPDASTATDLTVRSQDLAPPTPPVLPYPSLANQRMYPARSSSIVSSTPPNSIRSLAPSTTSSKGGFFASLGRKASMSNKKPGLPHITTTSPARVLQKNPPASAGPRVINLTNSPVVPGGPRAIPNHRAMRSQTLMATSNSFASNTPIVDRNEALGRRPSLFDLTPSPEPPVIDIAVDPEFVRQVDKLVHLLPNADRDVLAGYLRRAGQDILAIGQYLEDEKNGTIKPP